MATTEKPTALKTEGETTTAMFESFLTPEEDKEEEQVNEEVEVVETPTEDVPEIEEEETESLEEDVEVEEESIEEDENLDEEQTNIDEEIEQPQMFTVNVNGIEQQVTQEELINGYSRQQDYTRKTQELSQQRKTVEEQAKEVAQRDAIYSQLLPKMEAQLKGEMANEPDWDTLYKDDPVGYVREKQLWDEKKEKLSAVSAEQERIKQEEIQKQQELIKKQVEYGNQRLMELIPEWQNPEVAAKEKAAISEYAIKVLEYTPQEIQQVYDYRALLGLRNAWLNSKTVAATKKKPTQKAPARKVARPGTTNRPKTATPVTKAKQRLAKSGKITDAAKVFEKIL